MDSMPARGDAQHFARLDLANILRVKQIERASFRRDDPGVVQLARSLPEAGGSRADRARAYSSSRRQDQQRVSAFDLIQRVARAPERLRAWRTRDQMDDDFGIAVGLKDRAAMFELAAPFGGVGEIAVVAESELCLCCSRSRWAARSAAHYRRRWNSACGRCAASPGSCASTSG